MIWRIGKKTIIFCFGLVLLSVLIFAGCCLDEKGSPRLSSNIKESKKNDLFISQWYIPENPIFINDTFRIIVADIWLEKYWHFDTQDCRKIVVVPGIYQIGFNIENIEVRDKYHFRWYMKSTNMDCWINPKENGLSIRNVSIESDTLFLAIYLRNSDEIAFDTVSFRVKDFFIVRNK
jgi:hypothetical protein